MKVYKQFHGEIEIKNIGKQLREILEKSPKNFKVLTGHGSVTGSSKSKGAVLQSLGKMKREGLIKGFFPGDVKHELQSSNSAFYEAKFEFESIVKRDKDYGNSGVVFVFVK